MTTYKTAWERGYERGRAAAPSPALTREARKPISEKRLGDHLADIFGPKQGVDWDGAAHALLFLLFADGYDISKVTPPPAPTSTRDTGD